MIKEVFRGGERKRSGDGVGNNKDVLCICMCQFPKTHLTILYHGNAGTINQ